MPDGRVSGDRSDHILREPAISVHYGSVAYSFGKSNVVSLGRPSACSPHFSSNNIFRSSQRGSSDSSGQSQDERFRFVPHLGQRPRHSSLQRGFIGIASISDSRTEGVKETPSSRKSICVSSSSSSRKSSCPIRMTTSKSVINSVSYGSRQRAHVISGRVDTTPRAVNSDPILSRVRSSLTSDVTENPSLDRSRVKPGSTSWKL